VSFQRDSKRTGGARKIILMAIPLRVLAQERMSENLFSDLSLCNCIQLALAITDMTDIRASPFSLALVSLPCDGFIMAWAGIFVNRFWRRF
jgi:hypothetical protein